MPSTEVDRRRRLETYLDMLPRNDWVFDVLARVAERRLIGLARERQRTAA